MVKQILVNRVVVEKNGKSYEFHMPVDPDLGAALDAAYEVFAIIGKNIEERNKKAQEDLEELSEDKKEEIKEEE